MSTNTYKEIADLIFNYKSIDPNFPQIFIKCRLKKNNMMFSTKTVWDSTSISDYYESLYLCCNDPRSETVVLKSQISVKDLIESVTNFQSKRTLED